MSVVRSLKEQAKKRSIYNGDQLSLTEARSYFAQFTGGSVDLEKGDSGIATVTLNNPKKRNAISGKMMGDFLDVVEELERWEDGKGIILKGFGGNFCSGGDLTLPQKTGCPEGGYNMATIMDHVLTHFNNLPFVTVALVEGCGALGGGAEISVACDFRIMSPDCRGIGFVHGRMGIIAAWGGAKRLVAAVGYRQALEVMSSARLFSPNQLLKIGLVDEIIPAESDSIEYTEAWLKSRTSCSASVVQGLKLQTLLAHHSPEDTDISNRLFAPYWGGKDNRAALSARIKHHSPVNGVSEQPANDMGVM